MAGFFLEAHQGGPHMVEQVQGKLAPGGGVHALAIGAEVAQHLVDAIQADGREVVTQGAQIPFGVGVQAIVHMVLDDLALDLQALHGQLHQLIDTPQQAAGVALVLVAQARAVDGYHTQ